MDTVQIAIQGGRGCNHEIATKQYFNGYNIEYISCDTFTGLFDNVKNNANTYGVVAIENTLVGSILENYTLLRESDVNVIGELKLRISHYLMAAEGVSISDIKEVHSHPMALAQCKEFLQQYPHIKQITSSDTALSAKHVSDNNLRNVAAIAPSISAEIYNLNVLASKIETNKLNSTRFLIIQNKKAEAAKIKQVNKSSLAFALPHNQGSLSQVLSIFAFYQINLSKIQSLPIVGKEWQYMFYIDLIFDDYERYCQSLNAIKPLTNELKTLGEYHNCDIKL